MKSGVIDLVVRGVLIQLLALGLLGSFSAVANEGHLALLGATIIDGTLAAPIENGALIISDGKVRSIGPANDVSIPDGAQVIDVSGKTVIPGLINAHGHVGNTVGLESGEYSRANLLRQLGLYARYGVTTVFSLGGDAEQEESTSPGERVVSDSDADGVAKCRIIVSQTKIIGAIVQTGYGRCARTGETSLQWIAEALVIGLFKSETLDRRVGLPVEYEVAFVGDRGASGEG